MSGKLFYVIGPSGAGKDTLLCHAREQLAGSDGIVFAHRYITRPVEVAGENHIALSPDEFESRRRQGLFAMHWDSHGLSYGLGVEIDLWLEKGLHVVMNGSRAYLPEATRLYPDALHPIRVRVDPSVLRTRLEARGRESAAQINERLAGAMAFESLDHPRLIELDNSAALEQSTAALVEVLTT
ncbi:phosphonate metabolism protein/1,5-bisphosphokinase (PRPP-forming) PhnN [Ectothiorhodospira mobilis]|uniref:phosphonate metabolism protein/1,5-bisphosphokinase (PRPP-forming) PhnN n=1 Tax=Ectothiorhodospira mobilis TaxID=195064 RepID=UPI001EE8440C|nr:phosphonate metabolism protein/1,5-bisphosphokinase (PRPP-forming) PhnN [Ectothiorhodospira mobilis]MCG5536794.1 phosphonate metabolism protein/1,5-bisphosphokinase (PRPP-forming) PhnN [Ectothiorhodospira mobilis]